MLNSISIYFDCGQKTRRARKEHDEARAKFHQDWFRRALAIEKPENKPLAQKAFNEGYEDG